VIAVEVLSREPLDGDEIGSLADLHHAVTDGDCSGELWPLITNQHVTAGRMARLLIAQGSKPEFPGIYTCRGCGTVIETDGECYEGDGYDGLCGTCADRADAAGRAGPPSAGPAPDEVPE
jgi:hypothetical protein